MLHLSILPETFSVCRLAAHAGIPSWATARTFFAINRTSDELSIVCDVQLPPPETQQEKPWRAIKVEGPLDFALTGILAQLSGRLAEANISLFAISTFDTDYILVKSDSLDAAKAALSQSCKFI